MGVKLCSRNTGSGEGGRPCWKGWPHFLRSKIPSQPWKTLGWKTGWGASPSSPCRLFCSEEEEARSLIHREMEAGESEGRQLSWTDPSAPLPCPEPQAREDDAGLVAEGEPPTTASSAPCGSSSSREGTACLPLCSRDPQVTQQGGLWGGAYSLALGHLTQWLQLLGALGQPHPTVTLKPQWDLLRQ